jgi:AraC family transcriptional activator of mtrCDE
MLKKPTARMSAADLERVLDTLEVHWVKLSECLVSPGWRLHLEPTDAPGLHYNLKGSGRLIVEQGPAIPLSPHTLVIIPAGRSFRIEVASTAPGQPLRTLESAWRTFAPGEVRRFIAGDGEPEIVLICGYFLASYGASFDLFANLPSPIVEVFDETDRLDDTLKTALAELVAQEIGTGAMTAALLKQVVVTILRRSLRAASLWTERFSQLNDPALARALTAMALRPGAPHSVESLSRAAGLGRSVFMSRFMDTFGRPPMTVLRQLRMRQAALLLTAEHLGVEQVAAAVGYATRSGFSRAFRHTYGCDPSDYPPSAPPAAPPLADARRR